MGSQHEVEAARRQVIKQSLRLASIEWDNSVDTPDDSADLDLAHDMLTSSLNNYVEAVINYSGGARL